MTLSLAACLLALIQVPTANAAEKPLVGFYISTGDNDWLWQSPPVSSEASIRATFEASRRIFGVDRIYWRGFQSELLLGHFEVRPENFTGSGFWEWERHLLDEVGTSRMAVDIAREQGLEIWGMTGFFEHGASPATDAAKGYGPSVIEDRLRIEHPEWIPVDRRGIRRQAGPLELAYPAARKAQVKRYVKLLTEGGYDGVMFYNYVENFAIRFEDEFGFNEPIVREYKRRYGRDIRTEEFDHNAWYRLRGEYVTQFVRELSEGLHAAGKKFGITIDPQESHLPQPWLASRETINSGKVYLDWERWVREGLLDELQVYLNGDKEAAINNAIAICGEVDCPVSVVQGWSFADKHQHFYDAGVRCIGVGNSLEIEQGLKEPQTLAALDSDDPLAKLGLIHQSGEGDVELTLAQLTRLARDEDVLVRRQALVALGKTGVAEAVAEIEAGLDDPDQSVRCAAAGALLNAHGPESVDRILDALSEAHTFQLANAAQSTLANLPKEETSALLKGAKHADPRARRVAAAALARGAYRFDTVPALIELAQDVDAETRFGAVSALARYGADASTIGALIEALDDEHPTVRSRAAVGLQSAAGSDSRWLSARQLEALRALETWFGQYGQDSTLPDAEWGWRAVGNAVLKMGPRGEESLRHWLAQRGDLVLADRAWRILHVPQTGYSYVLAPEAEVVASYEQHPSSGATIAPPVARDEPETMPYLQQSFDGIEAYATGEIGGLRSEAGLLRGLGDRPPLPLVQETVRHGDEGRALRVTRGKPGDPHAVNLLRADYRLGVEPTTVSFWLRRETGAACAISWKDSGLGIYPCGMLIGADGRVAAADGAGGWVATDQLMPAGEWQRFGLQVDPRAETYRVVTGPELGALVGDEQPLVENPSYNMFVVSPQGAEGTSVYVDDVLVEVPNAAAAR